MFVTEPAVRYAGMAIQNEGRRLALCASLRPQLDLWLFGGWFVILFFGVVVDAPLMAGKYIGSGVFSFFNSQFCEVVYFYVD